MARVFPYLSEAQIERDAEALLFEFAQVRGITIAPPIPIENIVEKHLKLLLEFDDTHRLFKVPRSGSDPDILGGTPVFVGTRVPLQALIDYLEGGHSLEEFLNDFPSVSRDLAVAALEQAKAHLIADARAA